MADLARIKNNVAKMAAMNAPKSDIDGYIASEGVTVDDVRNYQSLDKDVLGAVTTFDKGYTGGFGRKLGGVVNAIGAAPVDALLTDKTFGEAFADRYNEIVDPALKSSEKFEGANPKTALALNIGGAIASPVNKLGMGYISKGATNLDKLVRSGVVGAGAGALYGAGRTENLEDLTSNVNEDAQMGGALGLVLPPALQGAKGLINKLNPKRALAGKATGLNNIVKDGDSVKMLKRGIQADDAIASQVKEEAPAAMNSLNERMREALNRLTGRKLNIDRANISQKERYNNFISRNANKELYSPKTAKQQADENFAKWLDGSQIVDENGQPLKLYHQTGTDFDAFEKGLDSAGKYDYETPSGFFFKSNDADIGLQGKKQIPVYIKGKKGISFKNREEARKFFRENIEGYDELLSKYNNVDAEYLAKDSVREAEFDKMIDALEKSPTYMNANEATQMKMRDELVNSIDDDAFYNEWRDAGNKYASQMKNKINNYIKENNIDFMRLENDSGSIGKKATDAYIVFNPNQIKSVNNSGAWSNSASLSDAGWKPKTSLDFYTQGLNAFQKDALNQALSKGAYMSTNAKGTLGATHRGQEVLNDMIEASYDTSIIGQKKPTTETRQLMQVKERLNQILEPSGIKPYDAGLSKAKALESAYEKGYKFKPSETKFEALGLDKARDKRAFLQGRIASILDNVKDDKNIAKAIQADENTLRKLMPESKYKQLLKDANNISTEYERVKSLANQAEKQVVKPEAIDRPLSERVETKGSIVGSLADKLNKILMTESNKRAANILLGNEKAVDSRLLKAIGRVPEYSLTPYFVDVLSSNK